MQTLTSRGSCGIGTSSGVAGIAIELGHQQVHHAAVAAFEVVLDRDAAGLDDELAQEARHLDHAAGRRQVGECGRIDVERAQRHVAAHVRLVLDARGHPHRALRRDDEARLVGDDDRHARAGVDQLRALVMVMRVVMAGRILVGERGDRTRNVLVVGAPGAAAHGLSLRLARSR